MTDHATGKNVIIKHIYKFEEGLAPLLQKIVDLCGFQPDLLLPEKKINQTNRKPWQEYFVGKPELIRIVTERCQTDEMFGYDLSPQL